MKTIRAGVATGFNLIADPSLILSPQNKERVYTVATVVSAVFSIAFNFYAIREFQQNGAAVVGVLAEFIAIVIMFVYLKKNSILIHIFDKNFFKIIVAGAVMLAVSATLHSLFDETIVQFAIVSMLTWLAYMGMLIIIKEREILSVFKSLINK